MELTIGPHTLGPGHPVFIVMEVAQAHDGSLGTAHAFIELASAVGADAVKFQTHIASAESTKREPFRVKFSRQDETRYDYWKRMEFTAEQWKGLATHAMEKGLVFLSSPFSLEAVDVLEDCGVPAWKVGSGEVGNTLLLERMLETGKPILLSTGMSSWEEIDYAVALIQQAGAPLMLYQCTSKYPCRPEDVGLRLIQSMQDRYGMPVGLSDHSGSPYFGIAAAALGAASVEVHMTMSSYAFGPDVPVSLVPEDLKRLVEGIRLIERAMRPPLGKDAMALQLEPMRAMFGRSIVAATDLKKGTILGHEHLAVKKPAGGIPPSELTAFIGKTLLEDVVMDTPMSFDIIRQV